MEQKTTQSVAEKIASNHPIKNDPKIYPHITALLIQNPSRLYAFPIFGGFLKFMILIPQFFILMILGMVVSLLVCYINPFVVLFTGKYMQSAYDLNILYMKWYVKVTFFSSGLTDKYPGFNSEIQDTFSILLLQPTQPSKFFAIPVIGYLVRYVALIPFTIWTTAVAYGTGYATMLNSFYVLFKGKYSETAFEMVWDNTRLYLAQQVYMSGLSDTYPSFRISSNHKGKKIALISIGFVGYIAFMIVWIGLQLLSASSSK